MRSVLYLILVGLVFAGFYFSDVLMDYYLEVLELALYGFVAFVLLVMAIYIKDRIAYHKLKKEMWKNAPAD